MIKKSLSILTLAALLSSNAWGKKQAPLAFSDRQILNEIHFGLLFLSSTQNTPWLHDKSFSPHGAAANFSFLYTLFKILETVQPQSILELGMGQTSKLTSQYAAYHKQTTLTVVENDRGWLDLFTRSLPQAKNITYLLTEIEMVPGKKGPIRRYAKFLENLPVKTFDLVLVDGPRGSAELSRPDILELVQANRLAPAFAIVIDDYERPGEQQMVAKLEALLKKKNISFTTKEIVSNKVQKLIVSPQFSFLKTL